MTSTSSSPDIPVAKKESISFAPPPAELALPRLSQDIVTDDDMLYPVGGATREHPESSHRRGSSADSAGGMRRGRVLGSPPPPPAYTPRGTHVTLFKAQVINCQVSFDTFDTLDATTFALTLRSKHR